MRRYWTGILLPLFLLAACGGGDSGGGGSTPGEMKQGGGSSGGGVKLTGAGATFPNPIYSRWFSTYAQQQQVQVNYQPVGSGAGIRQITQKTVDFGASDAPMTDAELAQAPGTLHIPTVLGSVAVTYNLEGLQQPLRLDGETLGAVFLGQVKKWNDPRIASLNPGVALPNQDILPVYRTDGSGTTFVFTDYLSAVSAGWKQQVGTGKSVKWPAGLGAKGNEGVTGQVRQTPGSIGYVELAYATENRLPAAAIRNQGGQFVQPSVETTTAAAGDVAAVIQRHPDFRMSVVNAPGAQAYPIAAFTYLLVPQNMEDCGKAKALVDLIRWALTEGGPSARELHYAPLPDPMREQVLQKVGTVTCGANKQPVA